MTKQNSSATFLKIKILHIYILFNLYEIIGTDAPYTNIFTNYQLPITNHQDMISIETDMI
jgi:hypothetical protein